MTLSCASCRRKLSDREIRVVPHRAIVLTPAGVALVSGGAGLCWLCRAMSMPTDLEVKA